MLRHVAEEENTQEPGKAAAGGMRWNQAPPHPWLRQEG